MESMLQIQTSLFLPAAESGGNTSRIGPPEDFEANGSGAPIDRRTVASRPVEVERTRDEMSVIARGLSAGETVVTDGQLKLAPGAKVSVRASIEDAP